MQFGSRISVILFLLLGSVVRDADAQSRDRYDRRVWIVNQTSAVMLSFYASNVRTRGWEEDILGSDVLYPGESVRVNIDDGTGFCRYDLRANFHDGDQATSWDFKCL